MHAVLFSALLLAAPTRTLPPEGTGLVIGGSLSLTAAAGFSVASVVMDHRVRRGTRDIDETLLVAASTTAFFAGVAGVTMVAVGARRRHRTLNVAPTLSSRLVGLRISGRLPW